MALRLNLQEACTQRAHTLSVPDELSNFFQLLTWLTGAPAQTGQKIRGTSGHKPVRGVAVDYLFSKLFVWVEYCAPLLEEKVL